MKEYIERAEALDICQKEYEERLRMADYCGDTVAWNIGGAIKSIPVADVVEVRRGRWERNNPDDIVVYCSQCMMPQDAPSNYCPSCGALMDKEDEHEVG